MNLNADNYSGPPLVEQWAAVPTELKKEKAWLLWRKVPKPDKPGKFDKHPYYADGTMRKGIQGSDTDLAKLVTFAHAAKALTKFGDRFAGVGIAALRSSDWAALDLDGVSDHPEAAEFGRIAEHCGAYVERSPSGNGLRAFVKRTGLGHHPRHDLGIELFEDNGFVTVTGDVTHPGDVVALPETALAKLKQAFGNAPSLNSERTPPPEWSRFDLATLPDLLRDEVTAGYADDDDRSRRVFGLCIKLARAGLSPEETYNIFADTNLPWLSIGEDRKNGDTEKARYWVWQYCVKRVYDKEQHRANERQDALGIGAGSSSIEPRPFPTLTLDEMLGRFVYLSATNEICDTHNPRLAMAMGHFQHLTAASRTGLDKKKSAATATLWNQNPERHVISARTWRPGAGRYLLSPLGMDSVNIWSPPQYGDAPADWEQLAAPFLLHVEYLIPVEAERERFLDWLAHLHQRPGETVHSHYLMIAPNTQGIGRNWLASLLARVWSGNVALSVNFRGIMDGSFNSVLSEKVLAVVDELHEGGGGSMWAFAEALKTELTREHRLINPKYGKQHTEFNCLRWLMLSNSMMALPLTQDDRRFWVVENPTKAKDVDYYDRLYAALRDAGFVRAVVEWLTRRDISRFKVGERPVLNAVKAELVSHTKGDEDLAFERLVAESPSDLITTDQLQLELWGGVAPFEGAEGSRRARVVKAMLARVRGASLGQYSVDGMKLRVIALRNTDQWKTADNAMVADEVRRGRKVRY